MNKSKMPDIAIQATLGSPKEPTAQSIKDKFSHSQMNPITYFNLFAELMKIRADQQARQNYRYGRLAAKKIIEYLRKIKEKKLDKKLLTANFQVTEVWSVECPHCYHDQDAPFNHGSPMSPMVINCTKCDEPFTLTYERD